jgi:hypothetical protein
LRSQRGSSSFFPSRFPLTNVETVPSSVSMLATEPDPGAVWDIGVYPREGLLYQTVHGLPTVGGYYSRILGSGRPTAMVSSSALRMSADRGAGAEELLEDVLEAWQIREILPRRPRLSNLLPISTSGPGFYPLKRDQGWSLYRVPLRPEDRSAGLDARLLSWLGDARPWHRARRPVGPSRTRPSGPQLQWNPTPEQLEAQRAWWRNWGRQKGHSLCQSGPLEDGWHLTHKEHSVSKVSEACNRSRSSGDIGIGLLST